VSLARTVLPDCSEFTRSTLHVSPCEAQPIQGSGTENSTPTHVNICAHTLARSVPQSPRTLTSVAAGAHACSPAPATRPPTLLFERAGERTRRRVREPERERARRRAGASYQASVSMHSCIHTFIHTYTYIHTDIHTSMHSYIHTFIHTHIHVHTYIHTYIHI
jgi:hypothetical protein